MSQHLYDLLQTLGVNPQTEIDTLQYLFSEEGSVPIYSYGRPLEEYIDKEVFRNLKMRGTFVHVADMRNALGISSNQLRGTFEKLFLFSEFLIAVLTEGEEQISRNSAANKQAQVIIRNILAILDKSNHKLYDTGDQHYIIIEDNKAASHAIEYVSDNNIERDYRV